MNWHRLIQQADLVYSSTPDDRGFRTWSLKKTTCRVSYYESFQIENTDKVFCSILESYGGCISEKDLATILGFTVLDNFDMNPKRYADKAELDIFRALIKCVIDWGLIIKENGNYLLTGLGERALKTELKYRFYKGSKTLLENANIKPTDYFENQFFPFFHALGISSEIIGNDKIEYKLINPDEIFGIEETDLIKRLKLQSSKNYHIFFSETTHYFEFGSWQVDIRLFKINDEYHPVIFHNNQICELATELLHLPDNIKEKEKKIEWGLYLKLIKDPGAILDYETVIPFADLLEFDALILDSRIVWDDNKLFTFIADSADANQWHAISNHCPIEVLKHHLETYTDKLDWTTLSMRIDDNFLIETASKHPWNFEVIVSKETISIDVILKLLLIPELKGEDWDWDRIMPRLDLEFIKSNIDKIDFDLTELTKSETNDILELIINYPSRQWDWLYISNEYNLLFILDNILLFEDFLNIKNVLKRAFSSEEHVLIYCSSDALKTVMINAKESRLKDFSINHENFHWTTELIVLLEESGFLNWASGSYAPGFECNPHIKWDYDYFKNHHGKIVTQKGFDFVSEQISNHQIVLDFMSFDWNWDIVSANSRLISNPEFILRVKDKLNINALIRHISDETLEQIHESADIFNHLQRNQELWSVVTQKYSADFIRKNIDYNWDWNILTRRFCSTIKIEALGNPKWIEKWDWKYLSHNLDFSKIYKFLDVYVDYWDWVFLSKTFERKFILENLTQYVDYWDWNILLTERFEKKDLKLSGYLPKIAACLSVFESELAKEYWRILTRRFDYEELAQLIPFTYSNELFKWDYGYFYGLPGFNPLLYLDEFPETINWTSFSSSSSLNYSLKRDESLYNYNVWLKNILNLLKNKTYQWNYKELSKLDSINWNENILNINTELWDWDYLSEKSTCFKKSKGFIKRFQKFAEYINFQLFSKREDSYINEDLIEKTIDKDWDWSFLSANQSVKISLRFINEYHNKPWDWEKLTARNDIEFDNKTIIALCNKPWDWKEISRRSDIEFSEDLITKLQDKPFDWFLVSQNKSFIPSANTLSILSGYKLDWDMISQNKNLSFEVLWNYREKLNWHFATKHEIVDFTDTVFLEKYLNYLDWDIISQSTKFNISIDNLKKFKNKLNWGIINHRKDFVITEEILSPFADVIDWAKVSKSVEIDFTEELVEKFRSKWDWQFLRHNPKIIDKLESTLSKYQAELNCIEFLEKFDRRPYIYHYAHLFNAIGIINERKIFSRQKGDGKFENSAGNLVARRDTAHNFARFYFRPQTPTQFYNECLGHDSSSGYLKTWQYWDGDWIRCSKWKTYYPQARNFGLPKCPMPVFFKFDLKEVLFKVAQKCYYSTGNMQTNWARVEKVSTNPNSLNTDYLYSTVDDYQNYKQYSQQEFLVEEELDFSELNSFEIICYDNEQVKLLKEFIGENNPICTKIHSDESDIYHRGNRELRIETDEESVYICSDYQDSAYFSISHKNNLKIEIIEGSILREDAGQIIAYPHIKFSKSVKDIEVRFFDETNRNWLIYKS